MLASEASEVIWAVTGLLAVVIAIMIIATLRNKIRSVKVKAGPLEAQVTLAEVDRKLDEVLAKKVVVDEQPLIDRVRAMEHHQAWEVAVFGWIHDHMGRVCTHLGIVPEPFPQSGKEDK